MDNWDHNNSHFIIKDVWGDIEMGSLRILSLIISFTVIAFIGLKTLNTQCFNPVDVNLALIALIFAVIVELISTKK